MDEIVTNHNRTGDDKAQETERDAPWVDAATGKAYNKTISVTRDFTRGAREFKLHKLREAIEFLYVLAIRNYNKGYREVREGEAEAKAAELLATAEGHAREAMAKAPKETLAAMNKALKAEHRAADDCLALFLVIRFYLGFSERVSQMAPKLLAGSLDSTADETASDASQEQEDRASSR